MSINKSKNNSSQNLKSAVPLKRSLTDSQSGNSAAFKRTNEISTVRINESHLKNSTISYYTSQYKSGLPFPHLQVKDLFPSDFLREVRTELLASEFIPKRNDLYDFLQTSKSLIAQKGNHIAKLRDYLYSTEFREFMAKITGLELNDTVDISAAQYGKGAHLLCHDDDLSSRRIAFILYLVPEDWTPSVDGGALDLFDTDSKGMPTFISKQLTPIWNSIAFFEVNPISFHQVAEVLSDSKGPRLSISGWFHGVPLERPPLPMFPSLPFYPIPELEDEEAEDAKQSTAQGTSVPTGLKDVLNEWINPMYLKSKSVTQMCEQLNTNGSLSLPGFLRPEKYAAVRKALGAQKWVHRGPPILQSYRALEQIENTENPYNSYVPDALFKLRNFLIGPLFMGYLSMVTSSSFDCFSVETRCFASGDYTMLSDPQYKAERKAMKLKSILGDANSSNTGENKSDLEDEVKSEDEEESAMGSLVNVNLCMVSEESEWEDEQGGYSVFLTSDEQLLSVPPSANTLNIVFQGPGVMNFIKYVNDQAPECRYDINIVLKTSVDENESE